MAPFNLEYLSQDPDKALLRKTYYLTALLVDMMSAKQTKTRYYSRLLD